MGANGAPDTDTLARDCDPARCKGQAPAWELSNALRRRSRLNQLIVIAFDHFDDARKAMRGLRDLEREGRIRFEDTAIVERDPDGRST